MLRAFATLAAAAVVPFKMCVRPPVFNVYLKTIHEGERTSTLTDMQMVTPKGGQMRSLSPPHVHIIIVVVVIISYCVCVNIFVR